MKSVNRKVCMVVLNNFIKDSRVIREAKTLVQAGFDLTVFALHDPGLREQEKMYGFRVNRIHLVTRKLPKNRIIQLLKYAEFVLRCWSRINKIKPGICHCHDLYSLPIGYIVTRFNRSKLIYDSHELWADPAYEPFRFLFPIGKIRRKIEYFIIKKADAVITVSNSIADFISKQYGIRKPYVIKNVPNLFKAKKSNKLRKKIGLVGDRKKIILYQGGIVKGRGLESLIGAMPYIKGSILIIMGEGRIKKELKNLALSYKVNNKVFFVDVVPPEELLSYVCSADIGIAPIMNVNLSKYYCLPNKLFEYLMAGLPVAVSDFPEMAKVVKEYEVGEVFNPDDSKDIARAINEILKNKTKYNLMKDNIKKVVKVYNWENESTKLTEVYEALPNK